MGAGKCLTTSALLAFLGFGFSAGRFQWFHSSGAAEKPDQETPVQVVTLLEVDSGNQSSGGRDGKTLTQEALANLSFQECLPRLDEVLLELSRAREMYYFTSSMIPARLEIELERILDKGTFKEVAQVIENPKAGNVMQSADMIFSRLAAIDPRRAGERWLDFSEEKNLKTVGLNGLVKRWAERDFVSADRWVSSLQDAERKAAAQGQLFKMLAESDPARALKRLDEIDEAGVQSAVLAVIADNIDETQLEGLADELMTDGDDLQPLQGLLSGWSRQNPQGMTSWVIQQDLSNFDEQELLQAFSSQFSEAGRLLSQLGPHLGDSPTLQSVAAAAWWSWLTTPEGRDRGIEWVGQNEEVVAKLMSSHYSYGSLRRGNLNTMQVSRLLGQLGQLPDSTAVQQFEEGMLQRLTQIQPEAVLSYALEHLPIGLNSNHTIGYAVSEWSKKGEPKQVIDWVLENLTRDRGRSDSLRFAMSNWTEQNPEEAVAFLMDLPDSDRKGAVSDVSRAWAQSDPDGFIGFLKSDLDEEKYAYFANSGFFNLAQEPGQAVDALPKLLKLPSPKFRHQGIRGLFGGWAYIDQSAAQQAIETVPEGSLRNTAIMGFNYMAQRNDVGLAFEMAVKISEPEMRDREVIKLGKSWMRSDAKKARAEIAMHPDIPASVKKQILNQGEDK